MFDVEVDHLTKRFGDFCAVDTLSFNVDHGEMFGLLGPNGAGKSTLIRMLTTFVSPTSGTGRIKGFDIVRQANDVRKSIGVIPQAMTSDTWMKLTSSATASPSWTTGNWWPWIRPSN
jgi:ABC-2 type transport system ATP-binding protein